MTQFATGSTAEQLRDICILQEKYASQTLSLLASANYSGRETRRFSSSVLSNITTEGYPGRRYHPGSIFADQVEELARGEAKQAFDCSYANVQPHSASTANAAVLLELVQPGGTIMGMELSSGGHLSHGASTSFSGKVFISKPYNLTNGFIDYDQIRDYALKSRPEILICGASSYPREICFEAFKLIAEEAGAVLLADISHISGLVLAGLHPTPLGIAQVVTTSTYKQLAGPRGGLILSDHDSLPDSSQPLGKRLDHSVFPLTQGTPDLANIAAKAVALSAAQTDYFRDLMRDVVSLASYLADRLLEEGFQLVTEGTDTHMILLDLRNYSMTGKEAEELLEYVGILANRNLIPGDYRSPRETSGLRIGTNTLAIRKFGDTGITEVAKILSDLLMSKKRPSESKQVTIRKRVLELCATYPLCDPS